MAISFCDTSGIIPLVRNVIPEHSPVDQIFFSSNLFRGLTKNIIKKAGSETTQPYFYKNERSVNYFFNASVPKELSRHFSKAIAKVLYIR